MAYLIDPDGVETTVVHDLIHFGGKDVLEIGAGDGRLTWRYANVARSVLAIEPKGALVGRATADTPDHLRGRVTFRCADATLVELPSAAFEVAVFSRSL